MEMILNPKKMLAAQNLTGILDEEKQLQMVSVDLTLAGLRKPFSAGIISEKERQLPEFKDVCPDKCGTFRIPPGCYSAIFNEGIEMPENATAFIVQRSSLNRSLAVIFSSVIDPGYNASNLSASLYVFNPHGIVLEKNSRVASIYFLSCAPNKLYDGFYQNERLHVFLHPHC